MSERVIPERMILTRTARLLTVFVASVLAASGWACGPARPGVIDTKPPDAGMPPLTWVSEFTRGAGTSYPHIPDGKTFGSLSGLVRDPVTGQYVAVIDDRAGTRVAWLSIAAIGGRLEVSPLRLQPLRAAAGVDPRIATQADLEAIVALPDGSFVMAEEGHVTEDGVWPPALLQVNRDGLVTGVVGFPPEFQIQRDGTAGVRDNQGFESLTLTPSGRLIAGLEQALAPQPVTTPEHGAEGRLIEFEPAGASWRAGRQWRYPISPTLAVPGFPTVCGTDGRGGENGLVDLLAITETTLVAMERGCWLNAAGDAANTVLLFGVTLSGTVARKTLLLDLSTVAPKLSPALEHLDNFEALAFGPAIDGRRSLLLVSDDNFRATQRTSFLLFAMR